MVFFVFARTPLIRVFFGGEKFDWDATVQTAYTLSYFALSLPFHAVYYFLTRCYYALFDSKTPFIISLFTVAINTLLSLYFILVVKLPIWSPRHIIFRLRHRKLNHSFYHSCREVKKHGHSFFYQGNNQNDPRVLSCLTSCVLPHQTYGQSFT